MTDTSDKKTVLVVDDAKENLAILVEILKASYRVKVAKDGERALKISQASPPPDLILLDVMMPGLDGYETCRRLKADAATRHIPVVFVTGHKEPEEEAKGLGLGAVGYLSKPIEPASVLDKAAEIFQLPEPGEPSGG